MIYGFKVHEEIHITIFIESIREITSRCGELTDNLKTSLPTAWNRIMAMAYYRLHSQSPLKYLQEDFADSYLSQSLGTSGLSARSLTDFIKTLGKNREVITFKGLMGGLTSKNDPANDPSLFRFPADADVQHLTAKPYIELGVGIDNILTCLRLDYIWRLTYRDLPHATRSGLRISLHFSF